MAIKKIEKRDGSIVDFNKDKITNAILKAMKSVDMVDEKEASNVTTQVVKEVNKANKSIPGVEDIQDIVEEKLMKKLPKVAKEYITYRNQRNIIRNRKSATMINIKKILNCSNVQNSNANIDEYSFGGRKNESANLIQKEIALNDLIDPEITEAYNEGRLYIHDLSEYTIGEHNCLFADIPRLLGNGFEARNGDVRPASCFSTACQLLAVIFQIQSQCQFGGVADNAIDRHLAPYVRKSFIKHYKNGLHWFGNPGDWDTFTANHGFNIETASISAEWNIFKAFNRMAYMFAMESLEKEGLQSTQALYHNLNTLESRAGSQVPFTSINFGLDTSFEGRKVTEWCLKASIDGIGKNHSTSIFPISIFVNKKEVNDRVYTPNYDLKKLAIKSLTKRIYPNFANGDWISNKADLHPIKFINKEYEAADSNDEVMIRTDFDYMDKLKKKTVEEHTTLGAFIKKVIARNNADVIANHKEVTIKLVNHKDRFLIKDSNCSNNDYNRRESDHYTRLYYISYTINDLGNIEKIYITTESAGYDIHKKHISDYSDLAVIHISYPNPKWNYNPDTEMATMGCRTLIGNDVNGMGYNKLGRGNVTPVTINLPYIGIEHGICLGERDTPDEEGFFKELNHMLDLATKELLDRYKYICSQSIKAGSFMYNNGTIADSDKALFFGVKESMKHGSQALGYIGLANACYAMYGKYFHQDKKVMEFAKKVIKTIYDRAKENTEKYHLNFSAYSSPSESTCYTLATKLQKKFGKIKNVCDRDYLTNSCHVPVYENISIRDKIDTESNFTWMCTGGCITYIELNSGVINNPRAVEKIINYAMNNERIPYFAINFPIDTCNHCGFSGEIEEHCPACGSDDIKRLRRVTGYITTDYRKFNKGKISETNDRVKHTL
jgi:anaerobic ribonucleoside-triphosphate reductase